MSAKARVNNSSMAMPPFKPDYRIGDLLWVRERNGKVWWPAMVTYDPNLGIFYRTKPPRRIEYHVQYFGITAIRGWVFSKSIEPVNDPMEKSFPQKGCSQKVRGEYKTAIKELQEALSLNHKERKLRFIFSFNPLPRSKKARKDSTSSRASVSSERSTGSHNSKQASSTTAKEIPRTSGREKEDIKPNVARTTVIASTAPQQSSSTRSRGSTSLNSEVSASQKSSGTTTSELLTSSRRKRSVSGKPRDQESARSTRNQSSKRHREKDKSGHCWCPDCSTQTISQDVKKLRCSSPPVEARTLNLDADLNNSVIPLELCEQQTPTPTPAPPAAPAPQPAFFFQPTFTPLGGLTYPPCMYMSLQYASLWPSGTGMPATPAAAAAAALGQTPPQVYTGLNMVYVDAQRQLLGADGFQNSTRMLPFSPPSLPSASFNTSPLLAPPAPAAPIAAIGSPPAAAAATFGHPTSPPLSLSLSIKEDTVAAPSQSILSPRQPSLPTPTPAPAPVISDMVATSTSKRPRRSNVRYGSSSNSRRSSDASVVEQASSSGGATVAIASEQPIPLRSRSHSLRSALGSSSTEPDIKIMPSNGHMMGSIGSCSHNIRSAILTPPTSSSEDSPSIDLDFERPILPNHLLANVAASSNSDLHTVSSSEETDSVKLEIGRKRKRESHSNKNVEKEGPSFKSGVCSICDDEDTELLVCGGHCYGMFHLDCLGLMQPPTCKFVCDECLVSSSKCFACGKSNGEVVKCSKPRCTKLYHLSCIKGNKLFSFDQRRSSSFTCPLHVCARCESIGGSSHVGHSNLLQCTMCPLALHKPDCLIAGCEVVNQTHMVCYQHIKITKSVQLYSHLNLNTCLDCGKTGSLFCCDVCSAAYHMECLDEDDRPANDSDSWKCPNCTVHDLSVYGSLVLCKFGVWRWWPCEVILPNSIPDNIISKKPGDGMFVVRFCGSQDFAWTYHGRIVPYTENFDIGQKPHRKPKAADAAFKKAVEEAQQMYQLRKVALEAKRNKPDLNCHYTKIKTNKYLVPRPPLDTESLDFLACQCTPDHPCNDDSTCVNRAIHIECDPKNCPVGTLCQNQRMQKCQNAQTVPFHTGSRGWGLKTDQDLSAGDFVIEYIGEILDMEMCKERIKRAHENNTNNFYMLTLDQGLIIDAGQKSNQARFINHSCNPNCETRKWRVKGEPRIGIFARVDIPAGTELTFDYHLDSLGNDKKKCLCGSKNCSGFLGVKSIKVVAATEPARKAKKRRKNKPAPKKEVKEVEQIDTHEDDCFICQDGGSLLLCERKGCSKAYHLECVGRKVFPPKSQKWECPMHYCQTCQKAATTFCSTCPVSYCQKHCEDKFLIKPGTCKQLCLQICCRLLEEEGASSEDMDTISNSTETESNEGSA